MAKSDDGSPATVRVLWVWGGLLLLVVLARLTLGDPSTQRLALRVFLVLLAVAEGLAGFFYLFSARRPNGPGAPTTLRTMG